MKDFIYVAHFIEKEIYVFIIYIDDVTNCRLNFQF
jgi:hypothetical protein